MTNELQKPSANARGSGCCLQRCVRQPRHRWFACESQTAEDGWLGPFDNMESALFKIMDGLSEAELIGLPFFVTQGRKLTKTEKEELGVDYDWEVDAHGSIECRLPNDSS